MKRTAVRTGLFGVLLAVIVLFAASLVFNTATKADSASALASVSGTVTAPVPFKAAQVYFRNTDKRILYMVYTNGGHYQATHLFPGSYEVHVTARGLDSEVQKITVKAGTNAPTNVTLRQTAAPGGVQVVTFDEMYPAGHARDLARATCIGCHGPNFLPSHQFGKDQWNGAISMMTGMGFVNFQQADRDALVEWLSTNFGPNAKRRTLKWDVEMPVDETKISKAMYIEYYLKPDPARAGMTAFGRQMGQDPHFDPHGNVWFTDRGNPAHIEKLDPRTGDMQEWTMPIPDAGLHGIAVDAKGIVWVPETRKTNGDLHLQAFDPVTQKFTTYSMNPDLKLKADRLGGHTPVIDAQQNVWTTMIEGDQLVKLNSATKEVSLFPTPSHQAYPYGIDIAPDGNIWVAQFVAGKIAKFDPKTDKWTEYPTLTQPSKIRRLSVDSKGIVWYGVFNQGKLGRLDPATGERTEIQIPQQFSQPYDVWPDMHDNIWISDGGQGGAILKFEPATKTFTYFPSPQITDQPKIEITREGAIWYCPRSGKEAGVGVLYPDVTKITTLQAVYPANDRRNIGGKGVGGK